MGYNMLEFEDDKTWVRGVAIRVPDVTMEPVLPFGWWASVVPGDERIPRGAVVLIETPRHPTLLRYLVARDRDGRLLLLCSNPSRLESRLRWYPRGSRIVGVVVEIQPDLEVCVGGYLHPQELETARLEEALYAPNLASNRHAKRHASVRDGSS
ncbi:MAG: hypothetical protein HC933_17770 [Pleurocapsa sp. SU_196_0]|nr:hypothetical protein [Pleurocapsa sp. SU_196_0]